MAAKKARSKKKSKKVAKKVRKMKKVKKVRKVKTKKAKKAKKVKKGKKAKKPAKKARMSASKKKMVKKIAERVIGKVTHYYDRIGVAVVDLKDSLHMGDQIRLKHGGKIFKQRVASMQVNHQPLTSAEKGQEIGLKVDQVAPEGTVLLAA